MLESLSSFLQADSMVDKQVTIKLLRSRNLSFIISFLYREFKGNQQLTIPFDTLVQHLGDYLETINFQESDEESGLGGYESHILNYDEKARNYINQWIDNHYLFNRVDEELKVPVVQLSKHVEKAFQFFELVEDRSFVGTDSKFKDIFRKLEEIIENSNPNTDERLFILEQRKQEIDKQIKEIKEKGDAPTYKNYQIKALFDDVTRLSNELVGDFKEVEENFKAITRQIYERQQEEDLSKGQLIGDTFDSLYALRNTDQGKSFYSFWEFLIDDKKQSKLQSLTRDVYYLLDERGIDFKSKSLKKLKSVLHQSARKVLDKNSILANKLSREVIAKDQLANRKTKRLMNKIRQLALERSKKEEDSYDVKDHFLSIDHAANIYLPLEKKLGEKTKVSEFTATAQNAALDLKSLEGLSSIFNLDLIDKKVLKQNIKTCLKEHTHITLGNLVKIFPLTKGLAELLAYISLLSTSKKHTVNQLKQEVIPFNNEGKALAVPQIIFVK